MRVARVESSGPTTIETYVSPLLRELGRDEAFSLCDSSEDSDQIKARRRDKVGTWGPVYWLDFLLNGGFTIPAGLERPLLVFISGPPGAGKSILVQQLCYSRALRLALSGQGDTEQALILTAEAKPEAIVNNLASMQYALSVNGRRLIGTRDQDPAVIVEAPAFPEKEPSGDLVVKDRAEKFVDNLTSLFGKFDRKPAKALKIVAFDGVDTMLGDPLQPWLMAAIEREFRRQSHYQPRVLIVTADSIASDEGPHVRRWAYICDVWIRMSAEMRGGYKDHLLEIVKARYQSHIKGGHLYKIYGLSTDHVMHNPDEDGPRPVLREGGLFVFPSLNYMLSEQRSALPIVRQRRYGEKSAESTKTEKRTTGGRGQLKLRGPLLPGWTKSLSRKGEPSYWFYGPPSNPVEREEFSAERDEPWPLPFLSEMVGRGMPSYYPTVLLGPRGAGKSGVGLRFLRDGRLVGQNVLMVVFGQERRSVQGEVDGLCDSAKLVGSRGRPDKLGQLKILRQKPGQISPEELLHRLLYWIAVEDIARATVVGIDEFERLYPRLASDPLFFPAMADVFTCHRITSMFSVVRDEGTYWRSSGIVASAKAVFSFERMRWRGDKHGSSKKKDVGWRLSDGFESDGFERGTPLLVNLEKIGLTDRASLITIEGLKVPHGDWQSGRGIVRFHRPGPKWDPAEFLPLAPEVPLKSLPDE